MDIPQEIVDVAKAGMLRDSTFPPTVFVNGTKKNVYMQVPMGEDHSDRVTCLMIAGTFLAQDHDVGEVEKVIFVTEGWMSVARKDFVRPSRDPNRLEVLLITALEVKSGEQVMEAFGCVRDKTNAVVELKKVATPQEGTVKSPLLPAFLTGYRMVRR